MGKPVVDWDAVRTAYITGQSSLAAIARQFGLSPSRVRSRAAAEKWTALREEFRRDVAERGREQAAREASEGAALIFKIAKLLLEKFYRALQDDGIDLSPHHAATWAQILLALEQAGRAGPEQRIIVRWVAERDEGDDDEGDPDPI